ncbi:unnamed protein product [Miscanthus lutarioriparius]|uniref:Uncharacterized protein n=1 Tax=Miscanthus lutarioriparius TaxID=422564 RepID=A0A811SET4_9POAL|nr:unnamed protein product [Miscanthus lutarioriparius]
MELEMLLPRRIPYKSYEVVGFAEGTNTIFINISTGIFTLDLKSKKARKVGEREGDRFDPILLPYVRFYTPRSS